MHNRTGAARLADGTQISPTLAAYLGCDAEVVPAFQDQDGNLINLGRVKRLFFRRRQRGSIAARNERGAERARSRA